MAKVSVLVPVYNVSAYIERCAHSLFQQTFQDIEYVFVNDCTPDDSMERLETVIKQYPARAVQVKIVSHEQNMGLAVARRTALLAASGEYVCCVDSDDYVEVDMVKSMHQKAVEEQADIVVADMYIDYDRISTVFIDNVSSVYEDNVANMIASKGVLTSLCNKMIRKKLWIDHDIFAPQSLDYNEDRHVVTRLYFYTQKIVKVDTAFYHYTHSNSHSITRSKTAAHFENVILFWKLMDDFLLEHGLYEKYRNLIEASKTENKVKLIVDVDSYVTRKKYAFLFRDIEMNYIGQFRKGEKIMLSLVHYRLFVCAQLFHLLLKYKNRHK